MHQAISRRSFVKASALAGAGVLGGVNGLAALALPSPTPPGLRELSEQLTRQWAAALLRLQLTDKSRGDDYGGIRGPGDAAVPGRIAETIYPLLRLASQTQQAQYLDAAHLLFGWAERRVSQPDGSWLNEPQAGSWKGTTVFMATALAEALKHYGPLLDAPLRAALAARLLRAGDFIHQTFTIDYGNINYPIAASYGLSLLGEVLDVPRFRQRGRELAHEALRFITPTNHLLFGEGTPHDRASAKGCYSIDLGYNVEESLPALVLYSQLTHDEEVLAAATSALQAHLEFMLPDGAWDNSWGTRNYKWTYWGSRTSDGCQPAYALLAGRDPRFYQAALRNTQLLQRCTTAEGLLAGGPHAAAHGLPTSVHHTFCHLKALTTILDYGAALPAPAPSSSALPREQVYGARFLADTQTWLLAEGPYRATVTAYDREYKDYKNGHATGGALTLLWHAKTGPLVAASMTDYQLYEAGNMVPYPTAQCLTPRAELRLNGVLYTNISDLRATLTRRSGNGPLTLTAQARLVDKNQQNPPAGEVSCVVTYTFAADKVSFHFDVAPSTYDQQIRIFLPLVAKSTELTTVISDRRIRVAKDAANVSITATQPFVPVAPGERVFNPVPGLEALVLCVAHRTAGFDVAVS
ncbi:twin-arginine translocation signal domain-containing protein [Hymenobacter sp. HMF4947]|uniref:Twin-arginine translocation signal domain-containing protein n=1 Tax=Hymenobacter ginkgonis TaxID=2682976 RepID=A0A7K1TEX6_9BACT|nr:twin-arginine translocation signal domain-containing protein [Hymenobacter ginkgonis]MVN76948.1 twin-arginine translocation signal domain-containing protein [Hymenobacter ginkgonis]